MVLILELRIFSSPFYQWNLSSPESQASGDRGILRPMLGSFTAGVAKLIRSMSDVDIFDDNSQEEKFFVDAR